MSSTPEVPAAARVTHNAGNVTRAGRTVSLSRSAKLVGMAELLGFHRVALTVSDRDASAEWYAAVLGFEETFREEGEERRACVMRFPGGAYSVGIVEHIPSEQDSFDPRRRGSITSPSRSGLETSLNIGQSD